MKKDVFKATIKIAAVVICLFSINDSVAQRFERRLPHKTLELVAIEEEPKQAPVKFGVNTKVIETSTDKTILLQQELMFQKVNQILAVVRNQKKESIL